MGVVIICRWLAGAVRSVIAAIVTDFRRVYDAACGLQSPQEGVRSSNSRTIFENACQAVLRSGAAFTWNHGGAMLAELMIKCVLIARRTMEFCLECYQR